ncbi:hypothetical protein N0V93_008970 [Gnomoniopsis smithogilvyi]|uniref:Aromatic-L-amino-acid decarboxylase n=1 Tax=Gnomoniopsis smithogilvyi TaxID=1191159 RepID=A0A9W8YJY1_9PEZI|nr:hypothetical protein N0V93_008970 [Gnomoniopsis smithogilvyi]
MDVKEFKGAANDTIDYIIHYYNNIRDHHVFSQVEPGYLRKILPSSAPIDGEPWDLIAKDFDTKILPGITHWQSPDFFAYFPCTSSYPSILGELYNAAFTGTCFNWHASPAATELETIVMDWLAQLMGLPSVYLSTGPTRGGGVIQGTASEAVLTVMIAARDKYLKETLPDPSTVSEEEFDELSMRKRSRLVALGSAAVHSCTRKAAKILGVRYVAIPVSSETNFAVTGNALAKTLEMCKLKGWEPFYLTSTLGTTDTCAVDDFGATAEVLAEWSKDFPVAESTSVNIPKNNGRTNGNKDSSLPIRKKGEIWVHVDAAYAGAALVTPEAQAAVQVHHLRHFHSYDVNMHKWLLVNFDASCLFVTDRHWLVEAMSSEMQVYQNKGTDGGLVTDYRNWGIPLGRRFRALKIWFVMRNYGVKGIQEYIRSGICLADQFAGWLRGRPDLFEIITGPSFALTVFRIKDLNGDENTMNKLTKAVYEEINSTGKLWVTSTMLEGKFTIRFMTANRMTEVSHVREGFELIEKTAERLVK